ncbi:MAG TPA: SusC/RagA family TonB-linked outer membrane protein [Flavobacterium sp.]|nr:SusC/RagA family TonB-linked outer membrane protein [Flavobacterium sp.]
MNKIYKKLLFLLLFLPISILAQESLEGTVVDSKSNQPLPGVNIVVEGSAVSTQTDFDGKFKFPKIKKGEKVIFSFVGYKNYQLVFANQKEVKILLEEESSELKEVVIQVGYGSVKKKDATGAVALLGKKDFNKGVVTNAEGLLNGRVAGVVVTQGSRPGDGAAVRIRGGSSLFGANDPLYVVDGLPIEGGITAINPNDIESFSVLKDASATAIYGSRAANGVIIITTKKGTVNEDIIYSFNSWTSVSNVVETVDVYSADEFKNIVGEFVPSRTNLLGNYDTDWQDEIFTTGFTSNSDFSVRGNLLKAIPTRLSVGYTDIAGVLKTSGFDRTSVSLAMNPSFFDNTLKINLNANYAYEENRYADEGAIGSAIAMNPTKPVYDASSPFGGYYESYTPNSAPGSYTVYGPANPLALLNQRDNNDYKNRYFGNLQIEYKFPFLESLKIVANQGYDFSDRSGTDVIVYEARSGMEGAVLQGRNSSYWDTNENLSLDTYLNYNHLFGNLKVDFTAGYSYQNFESESYTSGNTLAPTYESDIRTATTVNLQGFYSRLNIDLYEKYLVTLNYRLDGSSRFAEDYRWGTFPGIAAAWKISNENFLKDSKTISELKLRMGWGVVGSQKIPVTNYYIKRYTVSAQNAGATYPFGDEFYQLAKPEGYNETLQWEEMTTSTIGIDYGFLDNKFTGSIDVYHNVTSDLFAEVAQGALQNFVTIGPDNVGEFESKGFEFGLNYNAVANENSKLSFNFNATYNETEITSLDENEYFQGSVGLDVYTQIYKEGLAPNTFWLYQQVYDANGNPIEGAYVDRNEDGKVDSADKYAYHKPVADWTFGFMTNYNYKKFDFSMAWRASLGNYIYDNVSASRAFVSQGISDNNPNAVNNSPVDFNNTQFSQKRAETDYYVNDASWLKWDNLTIGYTFDNPVGYSKKSSNLRLYTGVQNVWTYTKYEGIDPEIFGGNDSTIYPRARMIMFGLNFNF